MEKQGLEVAPCIPEKNLGSSVLEQKINKASKSADSQAESNGISRRDFLKFLGAFAGLKVIENIAGQVEEAEASYGILKKAWNKIRSPELLVYRKQDNINIMNKVLDFKSKDLVKIDLKTSEKTKEFWKIEHLGNSHYSDSLYKAYKEMEENWSNDLKKIFKEEDVPEKFIYLAIPESYWYWEEDSLAGARGPYQFMADTGRKFGLKIDGRIDERLDPLKSGRACAKYLKYLHGITNDWDLTLAGYNGGLIWDYIKHAKNNSETINYKNFLDYLAGESNRYKKEYLTGNHQIKVEAGESLRSIARKYGTSEKILIKANKLKTGKVEPGLNLIVPVKSKKIRETILDRRKATLSENLNYPPKLNAVMEIIEEGIL